jgi:hypothetical protein
MVDTKTNTENYEIEDEDFIKKYGITWSKEFKFAGKTSIKFNTLHRNSLNVPWSFLFDAICNDSLL